MKIKVIRKKEPLITIKTKNYTVVMDDLSIYKNIEKTYRISVWAGNSTVQYRRKHVTLHRSEYESAYACMINLAKVWQ